MKSLKTILSVAIILLFCAVDLSAQEKKDDKRWEISGYFGGGGAATEGGYGSTFAVPCFGLGLEYYLTPRISIEGQISYLPNIAHAVPSYQDWPLDWSDVTLISLENKYRLLWDINFLFYFDLTKIIKRASIRWFLTMGTGYQYDREERIYVSLTTLQQLKYGYGSYWFQWISFGGGLKVNIKDDWALRLLYKIHNPPDDLLTSRLTLGLSCRF